MVTHLTKLTTLGQLESVGRTIEGKSSLLSLLNRWGFGGETSGSETLESLLLNDEVSFDTRDQVVTDIDGALFSAIRTELFSVKEIALKILTSKFSPSQDGVANALASHIYKSCSVYRELGHPDAAKVSLSSLRSLIQKPGIANNNDGKVMNTSRFRMLMEAGVDFFTGECLPGTASLGHGQGRRDFEEFHRVTSSPQERFPARDGPADSGWNFQFDNWWNNHDFRAKLEQYKAKNRHSIVLPTDDEDLYWWFVERRGHALLSGINSLEFGQGFESVVRGKAGPRSSVWN